MKRLCFGSFIKVFTSCKSASGKSQKNICGTVILSVNPINYDLRTDDGTTSDLANCRKNLTQAVIDLANEIEAQTDKSVFIEYFKKTVVPLINGNKKSNVVLALKDIIANDDEIRPDTVVDKVSGLTKAAIGTTSTFVVEDFFAGIFLYTATVVENIEGGSFAKTIDKEYMNQFENRDGEVMFVDKIDYAANTTRYDTEGSFYTDGDNESVDGVYIESDFKPQLQQNIYNQTIDVKGDNNVVSGFVFNQKNGG